MKVCFTWKQKAVAVQCKACFKLVRETLLMAEMMAKKVFLQMPLCVVPLDEIKPCSVQDWVQA